MLLPQYKGQLEILFQEQLKYIWGLVIVNQVFLVTCRVQADLINSFKNKYKQHSVSVLSDYFDHVVCSKTLVTNAFL